MKDGRRSSSKRLLYEKWWIWAIAGAGVVTLFCTLTLGGFGRGSSSPIVGVPIEQSASADAEEGFLLEEDNISESFSRGTDSLLSGDKTEIYVYVTENGKKFHLSPKCSGMKAPKSVTLAEAEASGYTACKKCCEQ